MKSSTWPVSIKLFSIIAAVGLLLTTAGSHSRAAGVHALAPITIGMSLSLTGDFSADGVAFQQGYNLWAADINKQGGLLGRPVKLIILSDASSPAQATTDYQKLINVDHVDLLFGPFSTLITKPASVVANRYGYALVEGAGGGPSVFTRGLHNVFDVSLPVANSLVSFAQYILALPPSIRPKTAAYATQDDPFTQPQVDVARAILEKGGIKSVYHTVYPAETTDYTPIADAVIHSNAQVGIFGTLLQDITAFIQAFRQQHFNLQGLIATAGPDQGAQFTKAIGMANTEGIFVPNGGWFPEANNPGNAAMVQEYLKRYGGKAADISSDVAEAYAVGQVVAQAVTKNNSLDNAKLIATLHNGTIFTSVQGPVRFDATGQNILAQAYLFQWQHGNLVPVFPASQARAKPEYPKPNWH
jgi:branched-chain amino acid transport system substrate-binding protein